MSGASGLLPEWYSQKSTKSTGTDDLAKNELPEIPSLKRQDIYGQKGVGGGVGKNCIPKSSALPRGEGIQCARHYTGDPKSAVQKTEDQGRGEKGEPGKCSKRNCLKIRGNETAKQKPAERELLCNGTVATAPIVLKAIHKIRFAGRAAASAAGIAVWAWVVAVRRSRPIQRMKARAPAMGANHPVPRARAEYRSRHSHSASNAARNRSGYSHSNPPENVRERMPAPRMAKKGTR